MHNVGKELGQVAECGRPADVDLAWKMYVGRRSYVDAIISWLCLSSGALNDWNVMPRGGFASYGKPPTRNKPMSVCVCVCVGQGQS